MLVKSRMSSPVITVEPNLPILEAKELMQRRNIRRLPVVKNGQLEGIVSERDLRDASPSEASALSIWELNYLIGRINVGQVMTKDVINVAEDTPIEEAAWLMVENKIGGLPVLSDGHLVGLITETDLFKVFMELMGGNRAGVRVTAIVPAKRGEWDALTHIIAEAGGEFLAFGQFAGERRNNRTVTFKVKGLNEEVITEKIAAHIEKLIDIRTSYDE